MIMTFAVMMIQIFEPIYLYTLGYSLHQIILFFLIVLENLETAETVKHPLQRINSEFDAPVFIGGQGVNVQLSQGVVIYEQETGETSHNILRNAGIAMDHAKEAGGNNVQFFSPEMNAAAKRRLMRPVRRNRRRKGT